MSLVRDKCIFAGLPPLDSVIRVGVHYINLVSKKQRARAVFKRAED